MQKVSIYIPVYNGEKTIKEVIDSVKSQSFSFDEVIDIVHKIPKLYHE